MCTEYKLGGGNLWHKGGHLAGDYVILFGFSCKMIFISDIHSTVLLALIKKYDIKL